MNNKVCDNYNGEIIKLKEKISKLELIIYNISIQNEKLKKEIEELKIINYDSIDEYFKD